MAGDWIKMRMDLPEDPAVYRLARLTGLDRLSVVGRLYAFWAWADKHAVDGRVDGGASADVDDVVRHEGFAEAMAAVKWLEIGADCLSIPKHDRHNGESAKERSLKNQRQARWRGKNDADETKQPSTPASTAPSTREEKRREEKNKEKEGRASPRGSRLPADWQLEPEDRDYCTKTRPELNPDAVAQDFRDYWTAKAGKDGVKLDWRATWQMWVRKQHAPKASQIAPGAVITVPGKAGRDPELVRLENESKNRAPAPSAARELITKLKQELHA